MTQITYHAVYWLGIYFCYARGCLSHLRNNVNTDSESRQKAMCQFIQRSLVSISTQLTVPEGLLRMRAYCWVRHREKGSLDPAAVDRDRETDGERYTRQMRAGDLA